MNKNIIRIFAVILGLSPWIYIGETLRSVLIIVASIVILLATVDISNKKKKEEVIN